MKLMNPKVDPATWSQLANKIKDADRDKKKGNEEIKEQIDTILGDKDLKITIPKNSKAFANLKARAY